MLHKFFEPGYWFEPKSYGYGAGLPIVWQGWVLLLSFIALFVGLALLAPLADDYRKITGLLALMVLSTAAFVAIVHKRTRGGWRWRWGDRD
jgi:hypothetical protein